MKANELKADKLMIGDWVYYPLLDKNVRVHSVGGDGVLGYKRNENIFFDYISRIEPIPITSELLEDNGWEREDVPCGADGGIEIWVSPDHRVELRSNKNHDMCNSDAAWSVHIDDENFCSLGSGEVTYLHELQNEFNCKHYQFNWKV